MFYNRTRDAKKAEFLKAGRDHRGKRVTTEQDASIAAYLYAEEDVHSRIKASGMYLEVYAEMVKLVFERAMTLEPPRYPDGTIKQVADGILGGPHTLDGLLDIARAAGVTRTHVPLTWESKRAREDYGDLNLDIVIEDTLVRVAGNSSTSANWIGIVDLPDGQYRLEHGLVVAEDTSQAPPQEKAVTLEAVNGLEQRLKHDNLRRQDRQVIEAELKAFKAQVGNGVTIKPVTYRNPQSQEVEPGAEVFLEGTTEPLAWISNDHLPLVTGELSGVLVSGGQYALTVLCPLGADNRGIRPTRLLGVINVRTEIEDDPIPEVDYFLRRNSQALYLEVVNGWQSKIKHGQAKQDDLKWWKSRAGKRATIRRTTFERNGVSEPAVAVYLEGHGTQFGWIARAQVPDVKHEMHGCLASSGQYTLEFVCD